MNNHDYFLLSAARNLFNAIWQTVGSHATHNAAGYHETHFFEIAALTMTIKMNGTTSSEISSLAAQSSNRRVLRNTRRGRLP